MTRADFLRLLFQSLDALEVRYCVLHSWEGIPKDLPGDLDLAVHPGDRAKLPLVFQALRRRDFLPVQCLNYFVNAYYFVFYWNQGPELESVAVDVIFEHRRGGLILTPGERLVAGRRRCGSFWTSAPAIELHYLLAKKAWKGDFPPYQQRRIAKIVQEIGPVAAEAVAAELFGEKRKRELVRRCGDGSLAGLSDKLLWPLRRTTILRHPFQPVRYWLRDCMRLLRRWLHPTGIFVVILGPDGVGKSTLVGRLIERLGPAFRRNRMFHFRPQLVKPQVETGLPVTNPHSDPIRGTFGSVIRLAGLFADFWIGHTFVTRPLLVRSGLVIFDRYFHDIMIDTKRYRYGGPLWLPRFLAHFVPPPDLLFLVLDAEIDVILSRKSEIAPEELQRLRAAYINMSRSDSKAALIKTDEGIEKSLAAAMQTIARYMAARFEKRHREWLATRGSPGPERQAREVSHA